MENNSTQLFTTLVTVSQSIRHITLDQFEQYTKEPSRSLLLQLFSLEKDISHVRTIQNKKPITRNSSLHTIDTSHIHPINTKATTKENSILSKENKSKTTKTTTKATTKANIKTKGNTKTKGNIKTKATTDSISTTPLYRKKTIPHAVKTQVWNKYIGEDIAKHSCLCCGVVDITCRNFHSGHIISEYNGGATDISNMRPICSQCNLSMGTQNMTEYAKTYFKRNII